MALSLQANGDEDEILANLDAAKETAANARNRAFKNGAMTEDQAAQIAAAR